MKVINVDERIKKAIVNSAMEFFKVPKELFTRHKECKKYYQPFLKELKKNLPTDRGPTANHRYPWDAIPMGDYFKGIDSPIFIPPMCEPDEWGTPIEIEGIDFGIFPVNDEHVNHETKTIDFTYLNPIAIEMKKRKSKTHKHTLGFSDFNSSPARPFYEVTLKARLLYGEEYDYTVRMKVQMFYVCVNILPCGELSKVFVCSGNFLNPEARLSPNKGISSKDKKTILPTDLVESLERDEGMGNTRVRFMTTYPTIKVFDKAGLGWCFEDSDVKNSKYSGNINILKKESVEALLKNDKTIFIDLENEKVCETVN